MPVGPQKVDMKLVHNRSSFDGEANDKSRSMDIGAAVRMVQDEEERDPTEFFMRSQDDKGHSAETRTKHALSMMAFYHKVVDHENTPYETIQDLDRDAMFHRAREAWELAGGDLNDPDLRNCQALARTEKKRWALKIQRKTLTTLVLGIIEYARNEDWEQVEVLLYDLKQLETRGVLDRVRLDFIDEASIALNRTDPRILRTPTELSVED